MRRGVAEQIVIDAAQPGGSPPANHEEPRPRVEIITRTADFHRLHAEWNALLRRSRSDCVFLTWEWLFPWWTHLGAAELSIVTVRQANRLIGVAPFMLMPGLTPALELLGTGSVGSDYLDLIVDREREPGALAAIRGWLEEQGTALTARQIPRSGSLLERLLAPLEEEEKGWTRTSRVTNVCPYAEIGERSWEDYLGGLSSNHRYNFRRRLRCIEKNFRVDLKIATSQNQRREALDTLVRLHLERWEERGGSEAFSRPDVVAFHDEASSLALDAGWLRLYTLRLDNRPVAALYGFRYADRFLFYQSGFAAEYGKYSVGLVLMGLTIRDAIADGVREYDLLHGAERYKFLWATKSREIVRLDAYPPGLMGRVVRRGRELTRASKQAANSLLPAAVVTALRGARRASS